MIKEITYTIQIKINDAFIDTSFAYTDVKESVVKDKARELFESMGKRHKVRIVKQTKSILYEL